jgi:hypothetical protein
MDISLILAIVFLATVAFNVAHWCFRGRERLLYFPKSGCFRLVFTSWAVVTPISAGATLFGWLPSLVFLLISFGFVTTQELYSIWIRQVQSNQRV